MSKPLYVAKPMLPQLSDLYPLLQGIWDSGIVTNEGPLHNQLEKRLGEFLKTPVSKLFCNGTIAYQAALMAMDLPPGAEIITTPLTFAATAHGIAACGFKPIFADVDPVTLTLDPKSVEKAITPRTAAVVGVHVYGTICDFEALQEICTAHGLKLIFDAAHAFAAECRGVPTSMMGDATMFSLHATKLFNTFEGGLMTSPHPDYAARFRLVRNFGIESEEVVSEIGTNGKMNELSAAIGLLNLDQFETERGIRSELRAMYDRMLEQFDGLVLQARQEDVVQSEQYYMMIVNPERFGADRDEIYAALKEVQIFSRRYFWPVCTDFAPYKGSTIHSIHATPVVEKVKNRVLCLPFHSGVTEAHVAQIESVLRRLHARNGRAVA